jgi:predicted MPP superfamily phosphohydrolase
MSTLQDKTTFVSQTNRSKWRQIRLEMERGEVRETPYGRRNRHWKAFKALIELFGFSLRMLGLYERGIRNATDIRLNRLDLWFENLPQEFNGFRLLQLSDLHADFLPGTLRAALDLIADVEADICVLTGDFRRRVKGPFDDILPAMGMLMSQISTRHGTYAVLGNHDSADMVEPFEALGIKVLINETQTILRNGAGLHLTGTDDIHYYYTPAALEALAGAPEGFRIALIHSPEFVDAAANNGFQLYLTGHTHGGQVCLPGGWPIITHVGRYRRYAHGLWRHGDMRGYTSTGVGVSGLPVRFNTRGEVALITLHAGSQR